MNDSASPTEEAIAFWEFTVRDHPTNNVEKIQQLEKHQT
jgi:hypothetical protein